MLAILTYHHCSEAPGDALKGNLHVAPEDFEWQLRHLRKAKIEIVSLDRVRAALLGEAPLRGPAAAITFDDGFADNHEFALPLLKKYNATAAFFVTVDWVGKRDPLGNPCMKQEQLRDLVRDGMTIGSHGLSHAPLGKVPIESARHEIAASKALLASLIGAPVRWFCYPKGNFNLETAEAVREAGYAGACSTIRGNRPRADQMYYLPRVMVMRDTSPRRFAHYFSPLYHYLHAWKNRTRWKDFR